MRKLPTPEQVMEVIGNNLPSPYAMDIVCRQLPGPEGGAVFDLYDADESSKEQWYELAAAVIALFDGSAEEKLTAPEQAMKVAHELYHPDPVATAEAMRDMLLSKE